MQKNDGERVCQHMTTYDSMELASLVPLRATLRVLRLSSTELAKIFGSSRRHICKELHFDATQWFAFTMQELTVSFRVIFMQRNLVVVREV
jgi:hypothetical protein